MMKKVYVIFFFLLVYCFADAKKQARDSIFSKWGIGILASADFYMYNFQQSNFDAITLGYYEKRNFYFSQGILITRKINQRLYFKSGLIYSEKGFNYNYFPETYLNMGELCVKERKIFQYYLELPLAVQYEYKISNYLKGFFDGDIITSVPIRKKMVNISSDEGIDCNETESEWEWEDKIRNIELYTTNNKRWRIHASIALGTGISYQTKRFDFILREQYEYYIINIYEWRLIQKPYSLKSQLNINYKF